MIEVFPASEGDCFLVTVDKSHILIDAGISSTYHDFLKIRLQELALNKEEIELLIVTHIDEDHIEGMVELFSENVNYNSSRIIFIKEVWHNSYKHLQFSKQKKLKTVN